MRERPVVIRAEPVRLTKLRLKHAFTLLTAEGSIDLRIWNIALQAGFSDISHFNRLFRSRFGAFLRTNRQCATLTSKVALF